MAEQRRESKDWQEIVGEELLIFLRRCGEFAAISGQELFLIGGVVRDLWLGIGPRELDFLVSGNAVDFARALSDNWSLHFAEFPVPQRLQSYARYGTAKLCFSDDFLGSNKVIDFASARAERYAEPGQPPEIFWSTVQEDLQRRDFTINAMALALRPERFGQLDDPFSGTRDLKARLLRILHEQSFIDDPARLIRGIRFAARLSFSFEKTSAQLAGEAIASQALWTLPRQRLFDELRKALEEEAILKVIELLKIHNMLEQLLPGNSFVDERETLSILLPQIQDCMLAEGIRGLPEHTTQAEVIFALLYAAATKEDYQKALSFYELRGKPRRRLETIWELFHLCT